MKKTMKVISILMLVLMMISIVTPVLATATDIGGVPVNPSYKPDDKVSAKFNNILGMIKYLGIFLAVGILMFLGIRYMMGSASDKAEFKKSMIPYVVGLVILLSAVIIIQIIQSTTTTIIG